MLKNDVSCCLCVSFASVKEGTHVLLREYTYVKATLHNRASFVRLFWRSFSNIARKTGQNWIQTNTFSSGCLKLSTAIHTTTNCCCCLFLTSFPQIWSFLSLFKCNNLFDPKFWKDECKMFNKTELIMSACIYLLEPTNTWNQTCWWIMNHFIHFWSNWSAFQRPMRVHVDRVNAEPIQWFLGWNTLWDLNFFYQVSEGYLVSSIRMPTAHKELI